MCCVLITMAPAVCTPITKKTKNQYCYSVLTLSRLICTIPSGHFNKPNLTTLTNKEINSRGRFKRRDSSVLVFNSKWAEFRVVSLVVTFYIWKKKKINKIRRYFKKTKRQKKTCDNLMWRAAGELYAHAIQMGGKKATVWVVGLLGER